jgi:hypothetical protein
VNSTPWILFCLDSAGPASAPCTVEIAAQRMEGWNRSGAPFHALLKPREEAASGVSAVFAHPLETLERDGITPALAYPDLLQYAVEAPWVAYELEKNWAALVAGWQPPGVVPPGGKGFCAASLVQRLLDPLPAAHCKIEILRQFYQLPERTPKGALSQLETLADLVTTVLRPIAESRGLQTWEDIAGFTQAVWFPSRITFGKFKGRLFQDALQDREFAKWLEWLAASSNQQSAAMGAWYLERLGTVSPEPTGAEAPGRRVFPEEPLERGAPTDASTIGALVLDPEEERLNTLVAKARARLAELEATYTIDKRAVEAAQSILFGILRPYFQKRDKLSLVVRYRRRFLEALLTGGEEEAGEVVKESETASREADAEYEKTASSLAERKVLSEEEEEELKRLWRRLVGLFHPDRFASEPDKQEAYAELTREINDAKDKGDIARLREIVRDPEDFMAKMGLSRLNFATEQEVSGLRKLLNSLESMILSTLAALEALRKDPAYELYLLNEKRPGFIGEVAREQARRIETEIQALDEEAAVLRKEILELNGGREPGI